MLQQSSDLHLAEHAVMQSGMAATRNIYLLFHLHRNDGRRVRIVCRQALSRSQTGRLTAASILVVSVWAISESTSSPRGYSRMRIVPDKVS